MAETADNIALRNVGASSRADSAPATPIDATSNEDRDLRSKKWAARPRVRYALGYYFFMEGVYNGLFSGIVPALEDHYVMSETQFSYMLLIMCLGGIAAMFFASPFSGRFGTKAGVDIPSFLTALNVPFLVFFPANKPFGAIVVACLWGFGAGLIEIVLSSQAVLYESALGGSAMGFFHAMHAGGSVMGSVVTGLLIYYGVRSSMICFAISAFSVLGNIINREFIIPYDVEKILTEMNKASLAVANATDGLSDRSNKDLIDAHVDIVRGGDGDIELSNNNWKDDEERLLSDTPNDRNNSQINVRKSKVMSPNIKTIGKRPQWGLLMLLTGASFICWMTEGSIADWSALYSTKVLKTSEAKATIPYAVFQVCMVIGRSVYDTVVDKRISKRMLIILNGVLGGGGLLLVVMAGLSAGKFGYTLSLLGFAMSGIGFSTSWPLVTSWSGKLEGIDVTFAVSLVNGISYIALVAGPPLLGMIADYSGSLIYSFALEFVISLICIPLGYFMTQ